VSEPAYRILIVCTGNICRSPFAERLFSSRLREALGPEAASQFEVTSAGTWGLVGEPMQPEAARVLVARGGDPAGFAARELTLELVAGADLVLAATREHRAAAVTFDPRASSRTLTLRELARLLGPVGPATITASGPVERMRELVSAAVGNRGLVPPADARDDDIADPYGQSRAAYEQAAEEIDAALRPVIALLRPGAESP
jgi:protein-tyrosine phosphatase